MLQKTKGIALHYYNYSESSVIAKIFTYDSGLQSFMLNGVRQKKAKTKLGLLHPLNLLDVSFYNKSGSGIKRIKELSLSKALEKIPYDINRQLMAVFIAEALMRVLIENEKDSALFNYVENIITELEGADKISNSLPLSFLLNLSLFLGFYPSKNNDDFPFFDLQNGCFTKSDFGHNHFIKDEALSNFRSLLLNEKVVFSQKERGGLLLILLDYFKLHHHELKNLKSHTVIEQLNQ